MNARKGAWGFGSCVNDGYEVSDKLFGFYLITRNNILDYTVQEY